MNASGSDFDVAVCGPADQAERHCLSEQEKNDSQDTRQGDNPWNLRDQTRTDLLYGQLNCSFRWVVWIRLMPASHICKDDFAGYSGASPDKLAQEWSAAGEVVARRRCVHTCGSLAGFIVGRWNPRLGCTRLRNAGKVFDSEFSHRLVSGTKCCGGPNSIPFDGPFPQSNRCFSRLAHVSEAGIQHREAKRD